MMKLPRTQILLMLGGMVVLGAVAYLAAPNVKRSSPATPLAFQPERLQDLNRERGRLKTRIDQIGAERAYGEFQEAYAQSSFAEQHLAAHLMGELLYEKLGLPGLSVCDSSFSFGCYHSFSGRAIAAGGLEIVRQLYQVCLKNFGPLGTGCQHGLGHGILEHLGHGRLGDALETCRLAPQVHPLLGCTSGVFMEYNFPTIVTRETSFTRRREPEPQNPESPCDTMVEERFRQSCYFELGQWWFEVFSRDYREIGRLCREIAAGLERKSCFLGLGYIAAPSNGYAVATTIERCRLMPDRESELLCRAGAAWSFFVMPEQRSLAERLCAGLKPDEKVHCLEEARFVP